MVRVLGSTYYVGYGGNRVSRSTSHMFSSTIPRRNVQDAVLERYGGMGCTAWRSEKASEELSGWAERLEQVRCMERALIGRQWSRNDAMMPT